MPCVITHYLFAEQALKALPAGLITTPEERRAFILGNFGPDPFGVHFGTTLKRFSTCRFLARDMHHSHMTRNFMCLREGVGHLSPDDQGIGRAFVLGFLGHWLLDSTCHPFVFSQQNAICAADEDLATRPGVVHAVIESTLDSWLLWTMCHATVTEFPVSRMLARTPRIDRVMGALVAYTVQNVFGTTISATEYARAFWDFDHIFRIVDPVGCPASKVLSRVEMLFKKTSLVLGWGHPIWTSDECSAANLDHKFWDNPLSGKSGNQSFPEIIDEALERWPVVAELLVRGDEEGLRKEIGGRSYEGVVVEDA